MLDADKAPFLGYALTWYRFVKSHHDDEEEELFPAVARVLGDERVWRETHREHGMYISRPFFSCLGRSRWIFSNVGDMET